MADFALAYVSRSSETVEVTGIDIRMALVFHLIRAYKLCSLLGNLKSRAFSLVSCRVHDTSFAAPSLMQASCTLCRLELS